MCNRLQMSRVRLNWIYTIVSLSIQSTVLYKRVYVCAIKSDLMKEVCSNYTNSKSNVQFAMCKFNHKKKHQAILAFN